MFGGSHTQQWWRWSETLSTIGNLIETIERLHWMRVFWGRGGRLGEGKLRGKT